MALVYLYPNFLKQSQEQNYYVTNHNTMTQCLKAEFNINSEWRNDLNKKDLIAQLDKNIPV